MSVGEPKHRIQCQNALQPWRDNILKKELAAHDTEILPLTPAISQRAADLIDTLALSHGMRLADALIGATTIEHHLTLLTANVKHFGSAEGLQMEVFLP